MGLGLRTRAPVLAFGILWFFAGHVLESTLLGLEIYFEHRNYLPSIGLIFSAVFYTWRSISYIKIRILKPLAVLLALAWAALFPIVTSGETDLWGTPSLSGYHLDGGKPKLPTS